MYQKNTELISFSVLFFLTAIFITYNINTIYLFVTNPQPNSNSYISRFSFLTSIFGLVVHFIGLLLIITTTLYLKTKNEYQTGNPLYLSSKYKNILKEFKQYFIIVFSLCFAVLTYFFYKEDILRKKSLSLEFTLCILAICSVISVISYYQFKRVNEYAKLRQKNLLISPPKMHDSNEYNCSPEIPVENPLIKELNKPVATTPKSTMPVTTTSAPTSDIQTIPEPTVDPIEMNTQEFNSVRSVLSEPTLKYSEFCSLNSGDITSLLDSSKLSFSDKAKFSKLKKGCNGNKNANIDNGTQSMVSTVGNSIRGASDFKANFKANYNPVNVQDKWMSENAPNLK